MLLYLSKALDTGCTNLRNLTIAHCFIGDFGIYEFLNGCTKESFPKLEILDLTNNMICEFLKFLRVFSIYFFVCSASWSICFIEEFI